MAELDLVELVRNRTMSPQIAATLWATAEQKRSFLVVAIPRLAGKSTVMQAMIDRVPDETPVRTLTDHPRDVDVLTGRPGEGYLVVPEVSQAPVPGYIWGEPVRRVFALLDQGYSLATALHAPGVEEAFAVLTQDNAVPDEHASRLQLMVYIRSLGDDWRNPTRRAIAEVHEIRGVSGGRPDAVLLHRWDEQSDRFEQVAISEQLDAAGMSLDERAREIERAVEGSSRTSS
jgi:type IV secretory pathway ATPase VirB11/archaellum biosynthesis ATPase